MELKVSERLIILSALPKEGDIVKVKIIQRTLDKLGLDGEEIARSKAEMKAEGLSIEDDFAKEIVFEAAEHDLIKSAFKGLSNKGKLHIEHLPLYERFVDAAL